MTSLQEIADYFAEAKLHDLEQVVLDAITDNGRLNKALEIYERERSRFRHTYPEMTGQYFLSGGHGETDANQLPQFIRICPAYGCAWEQVYEKTDKTITYEGS
jgi:hypothetical protein